MTTISIIGSGNMATAVGTRAAKHGHTIELMSRNTAKAQALADQIGNGATAGERPQPAALQGLRLGQATCSRIPVRDPRANSADRDSCPRYPISSNAAGFGAVCR
jgi:shikimate 5-dehydrogenase